MLGNVFCLPQVKISFQDSSVQPVSLAVAGGREPATEWLKELVSSFPGHELYCADKGLSYCLANNILPSFVCGDADSAGKELFVKAEALGIAVQKFPEEKDDTDLQLLLKQLPKGDLVISGVFGGRLDHLYSNIFSLLARQAKQIRHIIMVDDKELLILLGEENRVDLNFTKKFIQKLEAISLLPLEEKAEVTLKGVHWPLENEILELNRPYAISNVLEGDEKLFCYCKRGKIGLYCSFR